MKKSELKSAVAAAVKEQGIELDKNVLAVSLMQAGASLSMVNRELNKALKANGVEIVTNTGSEELKKIRASVKAYLAEKDDKDKPVNVIATYKDLREYAEILEDEFAASFDACVKIVKSEMKDAKLDVPTKVKLGQQKEAILNYFLSSKKKTTSLDGLCEYIKSNVFDEDGEAISHDKALHLARMNYTFANLLYNRVSLDDIN